MTIETLLSRLDKVQRKGDNRWMACCPAHDDKTPSLALQVSGNGLILMKCFAGCDSLSVLHAVNMSMGDLFPNGSPGEFKGWQRLEEEYRAKPNNKLEHAKAVLAIAKAQRKAGKRLNKEDMEAERRAFMEVQRANNQ